MAFELRENQGSFFKEKNKTNEKAPDYTGELNVEGVMYRLAGWIKVARSGEKWVSLSVELPREKDSHTEKREDGARGGDDVPF